MLSGCKVHNASSIFYFQCFLYYLYRPAVRDNAWPKQVTKKQNCLGIIEMIGCDHNTDTLHAPIPCIALSSNAIKPEQLGETRTNSSLWFFSCAAGVTSHLSQRPLQLHGGRAIPSQTPLTPYTRGRGVLGCAMPGCVCVEYLKTHPFWRIHRVIPPPPPSDEEIFFIINIHILWLFI